MDRRATSPLGLAWLGPVLLVSAAFRFSPHVSVHEVGGNVSSFVGLDRLKDGGAVAKEVLASDRQIQSRVLHSAAAIVNGGGNESDALFALLTALEAEGPAVQVIDMLEDGLDAQTQEALICFLRRRGPAARPLIFITRSNSILDVDAVGPR